MGRVPTERWGPRLIDIDVLLYANLRVQTDRLNVPHPELWNRRFVLTPLVAFQRRLSRMTFFALPPTTARTSG